LSRGVQSRRAAADHRLVVGVRPSDCGIERGLAKAITRGGFQSRRDITDDARCRQGPPAVLGSGRRDGHAASVREPPTDRRPDGGLVALSRLHIAMKSTPSGWPSDIPSCWAIDRAFSTRSAGRRRFDRTNTRRSARLLAATRRLTAAVATSAAPRAHARRCTSRWGVPAVAISHLGAGALLAGSALAFNCFVLP
jgi:hypothetical protein